MSNYNLFSVLGIEIEYMLVDKDSLEIQPKSDLILHTLAGESVNEVDLGEISASNELVMHVIELKNNGPKPASHPVAQQFQQTVEQLQPLLTAHNMQLLPTGAHPWMNPNNETKRWPHGSNEIYQQYDAIFDCQGHGWSNLQSMHVNMPFANDEEFCQLHNTIRLLLPLLPALAASTPFLDGMDTGYLDARLDFYGRNQQRIPSIGGDIIPEYINSQAQYQKEILDPMYRDINRFDPQGILQYEWLNSRAAIAKFEPMAIEIRILDSQECVQADIAIAHLIHALLKHWYETKPKHYQAEICPTKPLKSLYDKTIKHGLGVVIDDPRLLAQWQLPKKDNLTVRDVWELLLEQVSSSLEIESQRALAVILRQGNLSERILRACHHDYSRISLKRVYHELGECLLLNKQLETL